MTTWENDLSRLRQTCGLGSSHFNQTDIPSPDHSSRPLPIVVCIDVEAWEHDLSIVTEIGLSTLDLATLSQLGPNENGTNWAELIQSHHYIVTEYRQLVNKKFVKGCPDNFLHGTSQVLPQGEVVAAVRRHLSPQPNPRGQSKSTAYTSSSMSSTTPFASRGTFLDPTASNTPPLRDVIILGHALKSDISFLAPLIPLNQISIPNLIYFIDTQRLASPKKHPVGLTRLLAALDVRYDKAGMHNAGNDARLTMAALVKMLWLDVYQPQELHRVRAGFLPLPPSPKPEGLEGVEKAKGKDAKAGAKGGKKGKKGQNEGKAGAEKGRADRKAARKAAHKERKAAWKEENRRREQDGAMGGGQGGGRQQRGRDRGNRTDQTQHPGADPGTGGPGLPHRHSGGRAEGSGANASRHRSEGGRTKRGPYPKRKQTKPEAAVAQG